MTMTLELEAHPMPTHSPIVEPPQVPARLLRRAWRAVVLDFAYQLFRVYRLGWGSVPRAHSTYGTPQEAPTPSGSGSLVVQVASNVLWFGLDYTVGENRAIGSSLYSEALRGLPTEDQNLIRTWLRDGDMPGVMTRATEQAFERLATAAGLGLSITQGKRERRAEVSELLEEASRKPEPLNARVRRRA